MGDSNLSSMVIPASHENTRKWVAEESGFQASLSYTVSFRSAWATSGLSSKQMNRKREHYRDPCRLCPHLIFSANPVRIIGTQSDGDRELLLGGVQASSPNFTGKIG